MWLSFRIHCQWKSMHWYCYFCCFTHCLLGSCTQVTLDYLIVFFCSSFCLSRAYVQHKNRKARKSLSFNSYHLPSSSSSFSKSFSLFLDEFNSFLSVAATTPHEFVITGDFDIHLDNPSDHATSQFLSVLSYFNQHVNFPTRSKNHILDLVITSADSSLALSQSNSLCSPSDHFPIFTKLSINSTPLPLQRNIHFAAYTLLTLMIFSQMCCYPPSLLALRNVSMLSCSRTTPLVLHY